MGKTWLDRVWIFFYNGATLKKFVLFFHSVVLEYVWLKENHKAAARKVLGNSNNNNVHLAVLFYKNIRKNQSMAHFFVFKK